MTKKMAPITVNGEGITSDQINAEVQYHPADSLSVAQKEATQALVIRTLLAQEANHHGMDGETDEDRISTLLEQEIAVPVAEEDNCKRYYENNQNRFLAKETKDPIPFESVQEKIAEYLQYQSWRHAVRQYIQILAGNAEIKGFNLETADTPLVQ